MGYNVIGISSNGKDAIKKCRETKPDMILMDILLKGRMDGIKTAQTLQNLYNIPFIYLTGSCDNSIFKRAITTNPSGYLTKPFNDTELHLEIQKAINK